MTGFENVGVFIYLFYDSPQHTPYLLHIPARGLHVGCYPPQPVSVLGPTPNLSPSFLTAQAIFNLNHFPYYTPTSIKPSSFYTHLPAYEDGIKCSEMSAYKIQMLGNYPEESRQQVSSISETAAHTRRVQNSVQSSCGSGRTACTSLHTLSSEPGCKTKLIRYLQESRVESTQ